MFSFYGGIRGSNFQIKKIFNNAVEMTEDLKLGGRSSILIGDFVFISYGSPKESSLEKYNENKNADIEKFSKNYNLSLFEKVYFPGVDEKENPSKEWENQILVYLNGDSAVSGTFPRETVLCYRLIATLPSDFNFSANAEYYLPGENLPSSDLVSISTTDGLTYALSFKIPQAWNIDAAITEATDATVRKPDIDVTLKDNATKIFTFTLPQLWDLGLAETPVEVVPPSNEPSIIPTPDPVNKRNNLTFHLPKAWEINADTSELTVKPGEKPLVDSTEVASTLESGLDTKKFIFKLPRPWNIKLRASDTPLDPGAAPSINSEEAPVEDLENKYFLAQLPTTETLNQKVPIQLEGPTSIGSASVIREGDVDGLQATLKHPVLKLNLPSPWDIDKAIEEPVKIGPPDSEPSFSIKENNEHTKKLISMSLPKAPTFFGGRITENLKPDAVNVELVINEKDQSFSSGDFYIDEFTGNVFSIKNINKEKHTALFTYCSCVKGAKGDLGDPLNIVGHFNSEALLKETILSPKPGEGYFVGEKEPYDVVIWTYKDEIYQWLNLGPIKGPNGNIWRPDYDPLTGDLKWTINNDTSDTPPDMHVLGPQGIQGVSVTDIEQPELAPGDAEINTINLVLTDGKKLPFQIKNGSKGETGESGVYIGENEPTDEKQKVWLNPNGIADVVTIPWQDLY